MNRGSCLRKTKRKRARYDRRREREEGSRGGERERERPIFSNAASCGGEKNNEGRAPTRFRVNFPSARNSGGMPDRFERERENSFSRVARAPRGGGKSDGREAAPRLKALLRIIGLIK